MPQLMRSTVGETQCDACAFAQRTRRIERLERRCPDGRARLLLPVHDRACIRHIDVCATVITTKRGKRTNAANRIMESPRQQITPNMPQPG